MALGEPDVRWAVRRRVEEHVHGGVRFAVDDAARRLECAVEWHPGFEVSTAGLDPAYRGQEYVALAQSLGPGLTPAVVGRLPDRRRTIPSR